MAAAYAVGPSSCLGGSSPALRAGLVTVELFGGNARGDDKYNLRLVTAKGHLESCPSRPPLLSGKQISPLLFRS